MKTPACSFVAPLCAWFLAIGLPAFGAAPTGILANQGKLRPVITVANSYSEKVVKTFAGDTDSGPIYEVQPGAEKVSAKVTALLGDFDFAGITGDTEVALAVGDFSFAGTLGEAGTKTLGATGSAVFAFNLQVPQLDADGGPKMDASGNELFTVFKMGTLSWAWNALSKRLTATLALVIPGSGLADAAGVGGIASSRFAALGEQIPQGGGKRFANQPVPVSIRFGRFDGSRDAFVGGATRTKATKMGGADEPYVTTSVVLAGGADTRAPQFAVRVPSKVLADREISVFASLVDRPAPSGEASPEAQGYEVPRVAVYVDQEPSGEPDFVLSYRDSRGNPLPEGMLGLNPKGAGYLEGASAALDAGRHTLRFVATDSEGNTVAVIKTVTAGELGVGGMVRIPAGSYQRGDMIGDGATDAPMQTVAVGEFYIAANLVTKVEWDAVRMWGSTRGYTDLAVGTGKGTNHPVVSVPWYDVVKWANAASEQAGLTPCYRVSGVVYRTGQSDAVGCDWSANGFRLPTELEWEKAARGMLIGKRFPWGDTISHIQANYRSDSQFSYDVSSTRGHHPTYRVGDEPYTSPVGNFTANGYGLYDMAGNVFQWCWDWYGSYVAVADTRGPASGGVRVLRGSAWYDDAYNARSFQRCYNSPGVDSTGYGFRLAKSRP